MRIQALVVSRLLTAYIAKVGKKFLNRHKHNLYRFWCIPCSWTCKPGIHAFSWKDLHFWPCLLKFCSIFVFALTVEACLLLHRYKLQHGCISEANDREKTCRTLRDKMNDRYFWNTLCSILESKPGIWRPFFEVDNEKSLGDLKRYTWNVLWVHDAWLAPSEPQFRFRTLKSPNLWIKVEVLPGGRWLFGVDDVLKALMVDLDSGTHTLWYFRTTSSSISRRFIKFLAFLQGRCSL